MAVLEDAIEEFKKMPTAGKVAVGVGAVGVAGLALYLRSKSASTTASTTASSTGLAVGATGSNPGDSSTGTSTGIGTGTTTGGAQPYNGTGPNVFFPPNKGTLGGPISTQQLSQLGIGSTSAPPKISTYVVQPNDNLSEIASKLNIQGGWKALYNQNQSVIGSDPNRIYANQQLNLTGLV